MCILGWVSVAEVYIYVHIFLKVLSLAAVCSQDAKG